MSRLINVRVDEELDEAIKSAAAALGVTRSVWMREALASAADMNGGAAHPARALTLQATQVKSRRNDGRCIHPATARRQLPYSVLCTLCGVTMKGH